MLIINSLTKSVLFCFFLDRYDPWSVDVASKCSCFFLSLSLSLSQNVYDFSDPPESRVPAGVLDTKVSVEAEEAPKDGARPGNIWLCS